MEPRLQNTAEIAGRLASAVTLCKVQDAHPGRCHRDLERCWHRVARRTHRKRHLNTDTVADRWQINRGYRFPRKWTRGDRQQDAEMSTCAGSWREHLRSRTALYNGNANVWVV